MTGLRHAAVIYSAVLWERELLMIAIKLWTVFVNNSNKDFEIDSSFPSVAAEILFEHVSCLYDGMARIK